MFVGNTIADEIDQIEKSLRDLLSRLDPCSYSSVELSRLLSAFSIIERLSGSATAIVASHMANNDELGGPSDRSDAHRLARMENIPINQARRIIDRGKCLLQNPILAKEALDGNLSVNQINYIKEVADVAPQKVEEAVEAARSGSLPDLKDACSKLKRRAIGEDVQRRRIHSKRYYRSFTDSDGMRHLKVGGNPEDLVYIEAAVELERRYIFDDARVHGVREPFEAYGFDAFVEVFNGGVDGDGGESAGATGAGATGVAGGAVAAEGGGGTGGGTVAAGTVVAEGSAEAGNDNSVVGGMAGGDESGGTVAGGAGGVGTGGAGGGAAAGATGVAGGAVVAEGGGGTGDVVGGGNSSAPTPTPSIHHAPPASPSLPPTPSTSPTPASPSLPPSPPANGQPPPHRTKRPLKPSYIGSKIIIRIDHSALIRGYTVGDEVSEISGVGPISPSGVVEMIRNDDPFIAVVVTKGEEVLSAAHLGKKANSKILDILVHNEDDDEDALLTSRLGEKSNSNILDILVNNEEALSADYSGRKPNALQETALEWMYPTCAVKDCNHTLFLEMDHRIPWADIHTTALNNLDRLCSYHHDLKTNANWQLVEGNGKRDFVPPDDPRHPGNASQNTGSSNRKPGRPDRKNGNANRKTGRLSSGRRKGG